MMYVFSIKKTRRELFYVGEIKQNDLRIKLTEKIPKYMRPSEYIKLDYLSHNDNGKVDRKKIENEYL